jgi:hypothetical protein
VIWALARGDVSGPDDTVGDAVYGEGGDDVIRTRDGEVDRIDCGPGKDRAILDEVDLIADATAANPNGSCERVERRAAKRADSGPEDAEEQPVEDRRQS